MNKRAGFEQAEIDGLKQEVFEFLDELRDSGVTNMYGATQYLEDEFGMEKNYARELLGEWMDGFSSRHSARRRMAKHICRHCGHEL